MEFPGKKLLRLLVERDPASPEFRSGVRAAFRGTESPVNGNGNQTSGHSKDHSSDRFADQFAKPNDDFDLWGDVFVEQKLPWRRFVQSVALHTAAVALIWTISIAWIRQQKILDHAVFDKSALVTYSKEELLPPLDTGAVKTPKAQKGDPAFAKQPILSVPREADNRSQTIVVPPDVKLDHDVPMPNIVATGAIAPVVPLDAAQPMKRIAAPDMQVVAPAPDVQFAPDRVVQVGMKSDVIAPPPELAQSTKGHVSLMNIAPSEVVAPAPQLTLEAQHSLAARGGGRLPNGGVQPVAPPPSVAAAGGTSSGGRLVALGIHPVAATGPVPVPAGNRRGAFSANAKGKPGASGTPELTGSKTDGTAGRSGHNSGSLPAGLHVGGGSDDAREVASASTGTKPGAHAASPLSDDKVTDADRQVFGGKRLYEMHLNMPNLNSSSGSWVMKFAEVEGGRKEGELLTPVLTEKSDPGYPLELMKTNVHGMVTLYAVIRADGRVGDIRVLNSPDERLDPYAARALARWKFVPAERAGKPVALEAVVEIPFRVKSSF